MATNPAAKRSLYNTDFALWLEEQAHALKQRCSAALDWDNLAEEVEALVRSERRALRGFLRNALLHMLELAYWESEHARNERQWRQHLINARTEIEVILEDSPSLERHLSEIFESAYQAACREAEALIGRQLPEKCRWRLEQVRDDSFFPKPQES